MKIKNNDDAYLLDLKIDINTNRDDYFQELALLFDKPSYLNLLPKLRNYYKVINLVPVKEYKKFGFPDFENIYGGGDAKIDISKYKKIRNLKTLQPNFYDEVINNTELPLVLENECYLLCYEFNRPPYFYEAIQQSIYCNVVTDDCFKPTRAEVIEPSSLWFGPTLLPMAIFISSTSTYEDVKKEFRKAKEMMKTDKRLSYYKPRIDFVNNIRQYRSWYWQRLEGKTYQKIADDYVESMLPKQYNTTYQDVIKGVKIYKKLLTS